MSQGSIVPYVCAKCASECTPAQVPGPGGADGADGTNGVDGANAFGSVITGFTMPAIGNTVVVEVDSTAWMVPIQGGANAQPLAVEFAGTLFTVTVVDGTHVELLNPGYAGNSPGGAAIPAGARISPGGFEGPAGTPGSSGAPSDAQYIVQTADVGLPNAIPMDAKATGLVHNLNGTGIDVITPIGIAASNIAPVDSGAALTAGQAVFALAGGLESKTAANARTALGLGTIATQNANNVSITGGTISGVTISLPSGVPKDMLLYQNQQTSGTNGGSITGGGWVKVPLNTEVVDTGGNGSIAASVMTLAAGTYRARWNVPMWQVNRFQTQLRDMTAGAVIALGSVGRADATDPSNTVSEGVCRFTLAVPSNIELQAWAETTNLTTGFGEAAGFGVGEVYQSIEFEKES